MSIEPADDLPVDDGWRAEELDAGIEAGEEWPSDDLEAAYLKALEASEAVEWDLAQADSAHAG
ncbi:hypothetical protein ACPXAU_24095, partial [Salmonella enterica]|uniref:hypothetical protein n=1 Tax=Salmonella enterica TaxID=28901 RepID=UPI003CE982B1